jgi:methylthioribose-1-phosphate isomerase
MVVAPTSTLDLNTPSGEHIIIETRSAHEVLTCGGQTIAPTEANAWNPAFDVTPATLIDVIVTEQGIVEKPDASQLEILL